VPVQNNGLCPENGHFAVHEFSGNCRMWGVFGQIQASYRQFKTREVGIFSTLAIKSTEPEANFVSDWRFLLHSGTKTAQFFSCKILMPDTSLARQESHVEKKFPLQLLRQQLSRRPELAATLPGLRSDQLSEPIAGGGGSAAGRCGAGGRPAQH
jgi:hypothetical protein